MPHDTDETPNLATLRDQAERAAPADKEAAWAAYRNKHRAEEARRDKLRLLHAAAARGLGERIGRLPGIVVEAAEADDFGRAELQVTVDGERRWTRLVDLDGSVGYSRLRDAFAAHRRGDWCRANRWLAREPPPRTEVQWYGIDQVRFARNEYGRDIWP